MTYENPIKQSPDTGAPLKAPPVPQSNRSSRVLPNALDAANDNAASPKGKPDPLTQLAPALGYPARDPLAWWLP